MVATIMITFKKTFDFYATDQEMDIFVRGIINGPGSDPNDEICVEIDRDIDYRYVTVNILSRVLH